MANGNIKQSTPFYLFTEDDLITNIASVLDSQKFVCGRYTGNTSGKPSGYAGCFIGFKYVSDQMVVLVMTYAGEVYIRSKYGSWTAWTKLGGG